MILASNDAKHGGSDTIIVERGALPEDCLMMRERMERVRELFACSLGLSVPERHAFLMRACESDLDLLKQVESLLSGSSGATTTTILGLQPRHSRPQGSADPAEDQGAFPTYLKERYV